MLRIFMTTGDLNSGHHTCLIGPLTEPTPAPIIDILMANISVMCLTLKNLTFKECTPFLHGSHVLFKSRNKITCLNTNQVCLSKEVSVTPTLIG